MDALQYALVSQYFEKKDIYQAKSKTKRALIPSLINTLKSMIPKRTTTEPVFVDKPVCNKPVLK